MSQEQRTALNKAKREVQKKRRESKAAEKQPIEEAETDEVDAAAKVKTKALREYLLPNFYVTYERIEIRRQIRLDLLGWPDSLGQSPVPFPQKARICTRRKESQKLPEQHIRNR